MLISLIYEGDPITDGIPLFKERFEQLPHGRPGFLSELHFLGKWQQLVLESRFKTKRGFQVNSFNFLYRKLKILLLNFCVKNNFLDNN